MFELIFYRDANGEQPVAEYIRQLAGKDDKDSRIRLHKIRDYFKVLETHGTYAGKPYVKHIDGEIWELRPIRDRIFFAVWIDRKIVLLHYFMKKTQKTPQGEIDKAKKELADLKRREGII